jgi:hypothetical protein
MSGLHRDKRATNNSSRIWKVREGSRPNGRQNRPESRVAAQRVWAGAPPPIEPIRGKLMDPTSTAFEDEY